MILELEDNMHISIPPAPLVEVETVADLVHIVLNALLTAPDQPLHRSAVDCR